MQVYTKNIKFVVNPRGDKETKCFLRVSKKVGNAVARNRIKRLLRMCFIENVNSLPKGNEYIICCGKSVDANKSQIEQDFASFLRKMQKEQYVGEL